MRKIILAVCFSGAVIAIGCGSDAESVPSGAAGAGNAGSAGTSNAGTAGAGTAGSGDAGTAGIGAGAAGEAGAPVEPAFEIRALTYNTALAPSFEPYASERAPLVIDALKTTAQALDLLCVQEFWLKQDLDGLVQATASDLPNIVRRPPEPGSGDCSTDELLGGCLQTNCGNLSGIEVVGCAQQACTSAIGAVSGGCLGCIINNLAGDVGACAGDGATDDPAFFGGDFEVGLLSRLPMLAKDSMKLDAYFVRAAVLYAKLDVPSLGPVHAFCTHLGSSIGVIPYKGPYTDWRGEHAHQVDQLVAYIQSKSADGAPLIVLGDLNMGPAVGSSRAEQAEQYQQLLDIGLVNPYAAQQNPLCTDCASNTFNATTPGYSDTLIDHVLVRGLPHYAAQPQRVFEATAPVAGQDFNLSDHYGVRVALKACDATSLTLGQCQSQP